MKSKIKNLLIKLNNLNHGRLIDCNIEEYVDKIFKKASLITILSCGNLHGFIGYYDNDKNRETAYLTMIAVDPDNQGMGYGKNLINMSIMNLKRKGFKKYRLEVLKNNQNAILLYKDFDFRVVEYHGDKIFMEKFL